MSLRSAILCALILPVIAFSLTGCGGENWLVGKWTLDKERTLEELTKARESEPSQSAGKGLLSDIAGGVEKGIFRLLLTQFEGVEIEFTSTEIKRIREGVGETREYEFVDGSEKDVYILKMADGNLETWAQTDNGIRLKLNDEGGTWIYYRPAE